MKREIIYFRLMIIPLLGVITTLFGILSGQIEFNPTYKWRAIPFFIVYHLLWLGASYIIYLIIKGEL